ncbi:hypothetical protein GCK72_011563 [Caenorhabditis remanei]|uniref:Sdz-33 F-box domain-containing protein n=1 Tax=Caenorhabditis remanei TaxID=31234 RepID=A0A6A5H7Y5_CAERE|nr:hypothetical protein GCK72_011563 [Caenorhabditis remanei]KAF1763297.1 hypothetical protein GCK72_011563 [Caenorhabditis remanei]
MAASFRFTKLPYLARLLAMRMMTTNELVSYSLTSRKSVYMVRSVFGKRDYIEAVLHNEFINICTNFEEIEWKRERIKLELYSKSQKSPNGPFEVNATVRGPQERKYPLRKELDSHEWIAHFIRIFQSRKFKLLFDRRSDYSLGLIQNLFHDTEIIGIGILNCGRRYAMEILRSFKPIRQLMLIGVNFIDFDMEELEGYIFQNLDYFKIDGCSFKLGINRLLAMDCKIIEVWGSSMSVDNLNTFIRRWIAGTTNRNLVTLTIMFDTTRRLPPNYRQRILENIQHSVVEKDHHKKLRAPINSALWAEVDYIEAQYEIQGVDKRMVTIQFDVKGEQVRFKFVVGQ